MEKINVEQFPKLYFIINPFIKYNIIPYEIFNFYFESLKSELITIEVEVTLNN
jgi:hypothetical protein